jgi:hypothetical protein
MDRQNEDPAGVSRGAESDNSGHSNSQTHTNGNGGAQDANAQDQYTREPGGKPFEPSTDKTSNGRDGSGSAQGHLRNATGYNWRQFVYTPKELQTIVFPPLTFILPSLIPSVGLTLICSKPKVGKSWLLLSTCLSVTDAVLYLALEDGQRRMQSRHVKLLPFGSEWPEHIFLTNKWRRADQGGLNDIREWVEEMRAAGRKVAFIAVDVLMKIRPRAIKAKSAYEADYDALVGLQELATDLDVAIIVTHHARKAEAEDLIDKVSGTAGLAGATDTIIVIEQRGNNYIFDVRGRDVTADQLAATFDKSTCRWTFLGSASVRILESTTLDECKGYWSSPPGILESTTPR